MSTIDKSQAERNELYQFTKKADTSYYFDMLQKIATGVKYTAQIHNLSILMHLKNCLFEIIADNDYAYFTRKAGIRKGMMEFKSSDYFNFIYNFIKLKDPNYINNYVKVIDDKCYISRIDIKKIVNAFCEVILYPLIKDSEINLNLFSEYDKGNNIQPQNVFFNVPSNECRKAVLSNTQTTLSNSSFCGYGMYAYSDIGYVRDKQQDSYYIGVHPAQSEFKLMVVADGVGGANKGEIASNLAVSELLKWFESLSASEFYQNDNKNLINGLRIELGDINKKINDSIHDGATTICLSIIKQDSILICNVGDSQGYVIADDELIYTSTPANVAAIKLGIPKYLVRYHKRSNELCSCLGYYDELSNSSIEFKDIKLQPTSKYKVILCSDGVSDCLSESNIVDITNSSSNPAKTLVETAMDNTSNLEEELSTISPVKLHNILNKIGYDLKDHIYGGKDNTTAVAADINPRHRR